MSEVLSEQQIEKELTNLDGWTFKENKLNKDFSFGNFKDAISFIVRIAFEAEKKVHHPEIYNVYNTVRISLTTHDAGNKVTEKDLQLAQTIESLYN